MSSAAPPPSASTRAPTSAGPVRLPEPDPGLDAGSATTVLSVGVGVSVGGVAVGVTGGRVVAVGSGAVVVAARVVDPEPAEVRAGLGAVVLGAVVFGAVVSGVVVPGAVVVDGVGRGGVLRDGVAPGVVGAGVGRGALAAGGRTPGGAPEPNAHPSTLPGGGSKLPAPRVEYVHAPPGRACQYDQYAEAGAPLHGSGARSMVQTKPG